MQLDWVLHDDEREYASGSVGFTEKDADKICDRICLIAAEPGPLSLREYIRERLA
jgi:hypothetical protein